MANRAGFRLNFHFMVVMTDYALMAAGVLRIVLQIFLAHPRNMFLMSCGILLVAFHAIFVFWSCWWFTFDF